MDPQGWYSGSNQWNYDVPYIPSSQIRKEVKLTDNRRTMEIGIDCEMVEAYSQRRRISVLARVSIVNSYCEPILDTYVDPMLPISDYRTPYSGILPEHLDNAPKFEDVRKCVIALFDTSILVGHDIRQDLAVLNIRHFPIYRMRDTSRCYLSYFRTGQKPSLKRLAYEVLGYTIQSGAHDSLEDAKAAMRLYKHWLNTGENEEDAMPIEGFRKR